MYSTHSNRLSLYIQKVLKNLEDSVHSSGDENILEWYMICVISVLVIWVLCFLTIIFSYLNEILLVGPRSFKKLKLNDYDSILFWYQRIYYQVLRKMYIYYYTNCNRTQSIFHIFIWIFRSILHKQINKYCIHIT